MEQVASQLRAEGKHPYIIPEGGSNALGSWGYLEAVRELAGQLAGLGEGVDDIVFACGSGGTAAGLALGVALSGLSIRVHAVNVCDDADYFYDHVDRVLQELGASHKARDILDMVDGYKGLGYAVSQPQELELLRDVARQTGVILDPVYSGKGVVWLVSGGEKEALNGSKESAFFSCIQAVFSGFTTNSTSLLLSSPPTKRNPSPRFLSNHHPS